MFVLEIAWHLDLPEIFHPFLASNRLWYLPTWEFHSHILVFVFEKYLRVVLLDFHPLPPPPLPPAPLRSLHTLHVQPQKVSPDRVFHPAFDQFLNDFHFWLVSSFTKNPQTTSGFLFLWRNQYCEQIIGVALMWVVNLVMVLMGVLVCVLMWMKKPAKYIEESDSMTGRVNRFTNTTKSTIYKFVEACGNYWWVFWCMDKWQRRTIYRHIYIDRHQRRMNTVIWI